MPTLLESLQGRDLGHLRIVAELWQLEFQAPDVRIGLQRLAPLLLEPSLISQVIAGLPEAGHLALSALLEADGRLPWAVFTRRFGAVREMGTARRDRERPFDSPKTTPTEMLWYRALIGRGFFDTPSGIDEFVFIPDDLILKLPRLRTDSTAIPGRPASPAEKASQLLADDSIIDDAATFLAARRSGIPLPEIDPVLGSGKRTAFPLTPAILRVWLQGMGLLNSQDEPLPEPTRSFLAQSRGEALLQLFQAWQRNLLFDELRWLPGLACEGEWKSDPLRTRQAILNYLSLVPGASGVFGEDRPFWSLASFVAAIRQTHPDFQRTAGEYDTWYIRDLSTGEFLSGFQNWDAVEGELIRFILTGPLHWLGLLDLAGPKTSDGSTSSLAPGAFRFSLWAADLFRMQAPPGLAAEEDLLIVRSDGRLSIPRYCPRPVRYQVSRFCRWEGRSLEGNYQYSLTPASLERAARQGLRVGVLLALLRRHTRQVPPPVVQAIERWEKEGSQAKIEPAVVLRVKDPAVLKVLRNSKARRFLGDPLGPTSIVIQAGAQEKIRQILLEMGYLADLDK